MEVLEKSDGLSNRPDEPLAPSGISKSVLEVLRRTEYRRVEGGEDLEDIYRLRYKAYHRSDMVPTLPEASVHDALDELPNAYRFAVYVDGNLVSTLRLHHLSAEFPVSPSMNMYGDLLAPRVAAGDSFIDPTRFAVDSDWSRIYPQLPYLTLRLAGMACIHFNAPYCLSLIQPFHAAFYKKIYKSRQIGEYRTYRTGVDFTVGLFEAEVFKIQRWSYARYPFFRSTALERHLLFDRPVIGEHSPMTVIPMTAFQDAA